MKHLPLLLLATLFLGACDLDIAERNEEHYLNRLGYGPDAASVARIQQIGFIPYVDEQLYPASLDDSAFEAMIASRYPALQMDLRDLYLNYGTDPGQLGGYSEPRDQLAKAKVLRAVFSVRQLEAVLLDFWFNHFNVDAGVEIARWGVVTFEQEALRPHVLGNFEDMLRAVAAHPAMLEYLNNNENYRDGLFLLDRFVGLNENYGRELLELHTVGVDAAYDLTDIQNVARAFTGWTENVFDWKQVDPTGFRYQSWYHDTDEKNVMGALHIPAGGEMDDGEAVLAFLTARPETAEFISRKLARRFISDNPPNSVVQRAKQVFLDTGGDLRAVTRSIIVSSEFTDSYRRKVKRPLVYTASLARQVGVADPDAFASAAVSSIRTQGEFLYRMPDPTGYADVAAGWVGSSALVERFDLAGWAARGSNGFLGDIGSPAGGGQTMVGILADRLIHGPVSAPTIQAGAALAASVPGGESVVQAAALLLSSPEFMRH